MLDNLWSGALHLGVALCALAVLAGVRRKARNASLAGLGAVALAFQVLPHGCAHEAAGSASEQRWLIANVHTANQRHDALLQVVQERAPDLIGLVEVDSRWLSVELQ